MHSDGLQGFCLELSGTLKLECRYLMHTLTCSHRFSLIHTHAESKINATQVEQSMCDTCSPFPQTPAPARSL